ncbi:MAG: 3-deoxy-D-manno-octulosonic acid transferase [Candidatus Hydrogenedentota bacterium]
MLLHGLYNCLLTILAPLAVLYLRLHRVYRPLLGRFSPDVPRFTAPPVWVHAASVGEVNTAHPLLKAIYAQWPDVPLLLTTSTVLGMEHAESVSETAQIAWFPFDHPFAVRRFLDRAKPRCLILIETELWPNVLQHAHRAEIPIAIVNGRISARHFERYSRVRGFFSRLLQNVTLACMQTPLDIERITHLGVSADASVLTGNTKFDGAKTDVEEGEKLRLRSDLGLTENSHVVVFGSTRPGDEELAATCWKSLKDEYPELHLVVAPRHPGRLQEAVATFGDEHVLLRSKLVFGEQTAGDERVLFVDTMGELSLFYSIATVAVVGGSFSSDVQGHNPIEPAGLAVPTVFGPHMKNFMASAQILTEAGGAIQVHNGEELLSTLHDLLSNTDVRSETGRLGRAAVLENGGAIQKTLEHLRPLIER